MTEIDLLIAVLLSVSTCLLAAGGALWIARHDNARHRPPAGE